MLEKNVICDAGLAFTTDEFQDLFDSSKYKINYISDEKTIDVLRRSIKPGNAVFMTYDEMYSARIGETVNCDLVKLIDYVVSDKITIDICDRCMSPYLFNYATKSEIKLISMTISSYKMLLKINPVFLLFYECPHNITSWLIAKVAEFLSIPVIYCRNEIFTWRNVILEGMNRHPRVFHGNGFDEPEIDGEKDFFHGVLNNYERGTIAIKPEFFESMRKLKTKKLYSLWTDIRVNWYRPQNVIYKYLCYNALKRVCSHLPVSGNYVVFYLHLQPERTTLPEGYGFTQQMKAISVLNEAVPDGWSILVKEHPATFYRYCSPCGRWPSFYKSLSSLGKVKVLPLETDPYEIMRGCKCVCTIAGTIAREALMMGIPVVNFGLNTIYGSMPIGMCNYVDYSSLCHFLGNLLNFNREDIKESFTNIVENEVLSSGRIGIDNFNDWKNTGECFLKSNAVGRFKLFKRILAQ